MVVVIIGGDFFEGLFSMFSEYLVEFFLYIFNQFVGNFYI